MLLPALLGFAGFLRLIPGRISRGWNGLGPVSGVATYKAARRSRAPHSTDSATFVLAISVPTMKLFKTKAAAREEKRREEKEHNCRFVLNLGGPGGPSGGAAIPQGAMTGPGRGERNSRLHHREKCSRRTGQRICIEMPQTLFEKIRGGAGQPRAEVEKPGLLTTERCKFLSRSA